MKMVSRACGWWAVHRTWSAASSCCPDIAKFAAAQRFTAAGCGEWRDLRREVARLWRRPTPPRRARAPAPLRHGPRLRARRARDDLGPEDEDRAVQGGPPGPARAAARRAPPGLPRAPARRGRAARALAAGAAGARGRAEEAAAGAAEGGRRVRARPRRQPRRLVRGAGGARARGARRRVRGRGGVGGGGEDARGDPARLGLRDAHRRVQGGEVHQDRDALPAGRRLGERRDLHQPRVAPRDGGDGRRAPPPAQGVLRADPRREAQVPRGGHPLLPALDPRHQVPRRGQAGRRRCAPPTRRATPPLTAPSPHTSRSTRPSS